MMNANRSPVGESSRSLNRLYGWASRWL